MKDGEKYYFFMKGREQWLIFFSSCYKIHHNIYMYEFNFIDNIEWTAFFLKKSCLAKGKKNRLSTLKTFKTFILFQIAGSNFSHSILISQFSTSLVIE